MNMEARKPWAQLTDDEVTALKKRQCEKCRYFAQNTARAYTNATCDYIAHKHRARRCDPRDCVEFGVFAPKGKGRRPAQTYSLKPQNTM